MILSIDNCRPIKDWAVLKSIKIVKKKLEPKCLGDYMDKSLFVV